MRISSNSIKPELQARLTCKQCCPATALIENARARTAGAGPGARECNSLAPGKAHHPTPHRQMNNSFHITFTPECVLVKVVCFDNITGLH